MASHKPDPPMLDEPNDDARGDEWQAAGTRSTPSRTRRRTHAPIRLPEAICLGRPDLNYSIECGAAGHVSDEAREGNWKDRR
jgi:hypothetical protein